MKIRKRYKPLAYALITLDVLVVVIAFIKLDESSAIASIAGMVLSTIALLAILPHENEDVTERRMNADSKERNPIRFESATDWLDRLARHLLALEAISLAVALGFASSVSIIRYRALWPWWMIIIVALLCLPAMIFGRRENARAWPLFTGNLVWAFIYSVLLMLYRVYGVNVQSLGVECWAFVVLNAMILGKRHNSGPQLSKAQKFLAGYMIVGLGLTALSFELTMIDTRPLFDFAGVILLFGLLVSLIDSVALMRAPEAALWRQRLIFRRTPNRPRYSRLVNRPFLTG
jgi:hypothetical protein